MPLDLNHHGRVAAEIRKAPTAQQDNPIFLKTLRCQLAKCEESGQVWTETDAIWGMLDRVRDPRGCPSKDNAEMSLITPAFSRIAASYKMPASAGLFLVCLLMGGTSPVRAQDNVAAGLLAWRTAGCASCHGTFGEGGGGGEQPEGPSLRKTALDAKTLKETVRCGRPGSKMPFFLRGAYTATICWDTPVQAQAPDDVTGPGRLTPESIDVLVEYLTARVVGKSDTITKAECGAYFGNINHPACAAYP